MLSLGLAQLGVSIWLAAGPAASEGSSAAVLEGLAKCRGLTEAAAKASCYDAEYDQLRGAVGAREVIIVEKKEAEAARREAFGLSLPSFTIFDRASGGAALESVTGKVTQARRDERGRWIVTLEDGVVWRQIDDEPMRAPRPGSAVEIRRAAMGSFMMKVDGQRGVRARRTD